MSRNRKNHRRNIPARQNGHSDSPNVVSWMGAEFKIADKIGIMPMLRYANLAEEGTDSLDMHGLSAMYLLIQQCLNEDDWVRFQKHATVKRADDNDLMKFVQDVMERLSGRPTQKPSDSSDGPKTTEPSSEDAATLRVLDRTEGRPDLQLAVLEAQEAKQAAAN